MSRTEYKETTSLVRRFVSLLDETAPSCDEHVGHRYGRLLKRMWPTDGIDATQSFSSAPKAADDMDTYPSLEFQIPGPTGSFEGQSIQRPQTVSSNNFGDVNGISFGALQDFSLLCPDFSALETEILDLGVGDSGITSFGNVGYM